MHHPTRPTHATRDLTLVKPTGHLTLGNLLGALRPMAARQDVADCFHGVADLHALTTPQDPARLRLLTREVATTMLAAGLDRGTLFVQSRVPAHTRLAFLLECVATTGELDRMIQFKEKGPRRRLDPGLAADLPHPDGGRHPALPAPAGAGR